jgi:hypothetical protein
MRMKMRIRGAAKACGFHTRRQQMRVEERTYRLTINLYDCDHLDECTLSWVGLSLSVWVRLA